MDYPATASLTLWVDGDACPGAVRELILRAVSRRGLRLVWVTNQAGAGGLRNSETLTVVHVPAGPDVADQYIVDHAQPGDLVVTQDIPLAAQLVPREIAVISVHGTVYSAANIGERLAVRDFLQDMRDCGQQTGGPRPFNERDKRQFANALDQQLTRLLRGR